jgi:hypothetical protein
MIDSIGGRKVLAAAIVMALAVGAVLLKGDVPPNFLQLLQVVFGAFVLGNGIEHVAGAVGSKAATSSEVVDQFGTVVTQVGTQLGELKAESARTQEAVATVQNSLAALIQRVLGAQ